MRTFYATQGPRHAKKTYRDHTVLSPRILIALKIAITPPNRLEHPLRSLLDSFYLPSLRPQTRLLRRSLLENVPDSYDVDADGLTLFLYSIYFSVRHIEGSA
jgi:hypothetical protein